MRSFSLYVARRFLFSSALPGAVRVLSWVSLVGIALGTASLWLVLSVFNGFHGLVYDLYQKFDADIRITAASGRYLPVSDSLITYLRTSGGVAALTYTLEGRAVLAYADHQTIVQVKGIRSDFSAVSAAHQLVQYGSFNLTDTLEYPRLVLGEGVAAALAVNLNDDARPLQLYTVTDGTSILQASPDALQSYPAFASGVFVMQKEYADKVVLAEYGFAQKLFRVEDRCTAYELKLTDGANDEQVQQALQLALGSKYQVQNWQGQHPSLFAVLQNEKFVSYLVLVLMLLLLACTVVGMLSMVVIDKQREVALLRALGVEAAQIQHVFIWMGVLLGSYGLGAGLILGGTLGWLQQSFGLLKMKGGEHFMIDSFPLRLSSIDAVLITVTVLMLSLAAAWYPARKAAAAQLAQWLRAT